MPGVASIVMLGVASTMISSVESDMLVSDASATSFTDVVMGSVVASPARRRRVKVCRGGDDSRVIETVDVGVDWGDGEAEDSNAGRGGDASTWLWRDLQPGRPREAHSLSATKQSVQCHTHSGRGHTPAIFSEVCQYTLYLQQAIRIELSEGQGSHAPCRTSMSA